MSAFIDVPEFSDLLGLPFERGARGPNSFDCYGLAIEIFRRAGIEIPDFKSPGTIEEIGDLITAASRNWQPVAIGTVGALVTFRVDGIGAHVGICIGNDRILHCMEGVGVTTERLTGGLLRPLASYIYA